MLLVWILIANSIIHLTGMEYSWMIFLSNIMMFTLEGDVKDRFVTVELVVLWVWILTVIALLSITAPDPGAGRLLLASSCRWPWYCSSSSSAPLRTQGAEQRGLCLPDRGLH